MVTKIAKASTVHRKRLQAPTIATMDLSMGSGAIGFSNDGITGVSVDFAMLYYRQSEEKSAKAPLAHKVRIVRGNPNLGKMFRYAGSVAALNPWRCALRRRRSRRAWTAVLMLHVLWCRKFIAKASGMCNKGD